MKRKSVLFLISFIIIFLVLGVIYIKNNFMVNNNLNKINYIDNGYNKETNTENNNEKNAKSEKSVKADKEDLTFDEKLNKQVEYSENHIKGIDIKPFLEINLKKNLENFGNEFKNTDFITDYKEEAVNHYCESTKRNLTNGIKEWIKFKYKENFNVQILCYDNDNYATESVKPYSHEMSSQNTIYKEKNKEYSIFCEDFGDTNYYGIVFKDRNFLISIKAEYDKNSKTTISDINETIKELAHKIEILNT